MERLSRWAIAGSLAWLVVAVGVILGTHGGAALEIRAFEVEHNLPAGSWSVLPAAAGTNVEFQESRAC